MKNKKIIFKNKPEEVLDDDFQETGDEENFSAVSLDESLLNIDLFGQVNEKMVLTFKRYFLKLKNVYEKLPARSQNPVTITINSSGGNANDGFAIFDIIRSSGMPVTTVALGSAESAALIIFLAGDKRRIHQNAVLLTHETHEYDLEGAHTAHSLITVGKQLLTIDKLINKTILENSQITPPILARLKKSEKLITAEETVRYGLAHEIIKNS